MAAREAIGMDLGGTKLLTGVVDSDLKVHHESRERSTGASEDEILDVLEQEINEARQARPDVVAAGLGIPCTIDREKGLAVNAVNLEITDVPIRDIIAEHRFGVAKGATNALMLTLGTGIGGGIIIDGELYRGTTGAAGELGHVVVDEDGPPCQGTCPNHGCVETMASGPALAREGAAAAGRNPESALGRALAHGAIEGRTVTKAAEEGDEVAIEVVATAGRYLGVALASLVNVFDPDLIVIGGGVSEVGDLILQPAREEMAKRALPPMNKIPVKRAEMGGDAGMIGAAEMALEESG
jgi:glucokinase